MSVHYDHLHGQACLILNIECRPESDDFDVLLEPNLTSDLMRHIFEPRTKAEDVISLAIDRNAAQRFPWGVLELNTERIVAARRNVLPKIVSFETAARIDHHSHLLSADDPQIAMVHQRRHRGVLLR